MQKSTVYIFILELGGQSTSSQILVMSVRHRDRGWPDHRYMIFVVFLWYFSSLLFLWGGGGGGLLICKFCQTGPSTWLIIDLLTKTVKVTCTHNVYIYTKYNSYDYDTCSPGKTDLVYAYSYMYTVSFQKFSGSFLSLLLQII